MSKDSHYSIADPSKPKNPLPNDFENFVPWALTALSVDIDLVITKVVQDEYVSARTSARSKAKDKLKSKMKVDSTTTVDTKDDSNDWLQPQEPVRGNTVFLQTTYDAYDNLVHMTFNSRYPIPRELMKMIVLIVKFYPQLSTITINKGLSLAVIYEMQPLLSISTITDLCLDNTKERNYHMLLQTEGNIKYLSLARCNIDDAVVEDIAIALTYPSKGSQTLQLLNLTTNRITDTGAKHIAEALRSNRKLCYLNLSDNMIADDGAISICDALIEFRLTDEEILAFKSRRLTYLRKKHKIIREVIKDLQTNDVDGKLSKKKLTKPNSACPKAKSTINTKDSSGKALMSKDNADSVWEKANQIAETIIEPFNDPFLETILKDDLTYCLGNNILCYLNLSYNNLSFISLKKIFNVVATQKDCDRKPTGLIKLCIEGNPMPHYCHELIMLSDLLEDGLMKFSRRLSATSRKRVQSRITLK